MPPAATPSVTSAASVLSSEEAAELAAIAVALPDGWYVGVAKFTGQLLITPYLSWATPPLEVVVDARTRRVYAGLGWQLRHTRDLDRLRRTDDVGDSVTGARPKRPRRSTV